MIDVRDHTLYTSYRIKQSLHIPNTSFTNTIQKQYENTDSCSPTSSSTFISTSSSFSYTYLLPDYPIPFYLLCNDLTIAHSIYHILITKWKHIYILCCTIPVQQFNQFSSIIHKQPSSTEIQIQQSYSNLIEIDSIDNSFWNLLQQQQLVDISSAITPVLLYTPAPLLQEYIHMIEQQLIVDQTDIDCTHTFTCCDIGCGSGRDDIWLATRHISHSTQNNDVYKWYITCIDENPLNLQKLTWLSTYMQVQTQIQIQQVKITQQSIVKRMQEKTIDSPTNSLSSCSATPDGDSIPSTAVSCIDSPSVSSDLSNHYTDDTTNNLSNDSTSLNTNTRKTKKAARVQKALQKKLKIQQNGNIEQSSCIDTSPLFHTQQYDLILCIRFLVRSFLPLIRSMITPGGYLIYSTFQKHPTLIYEHPTSAQHLLQEKELAQVFNETYGFEIIMDRIDVLIDGRWLNSFIARKRKS